jgi:hypothetical protein
MTFLFRFGAASGLLAGVAIGIPGTIEAFTGKTTPTSFVLGLSPFVALPLLVALHLSQARVAGRLGAAGYAVTLVGTGMFGAAAYTLDIALIHFDRPVVTHLLRGLTGIAVLASALVFIAGCVLFGLSMVRAGVYPRLPAWGYAVVLPVFALSAPLPYSPYKGILHVLAAAVLIWLSLALARQPGAVSSRELSSPPASFPAGAAR